MDGKFSVIAVNEESYVKDLMIHEAWLAVLSTVLIFHPTSWMIKINDKHIRVSVLAQQPPTRSKTAKKSSTASLQILCFFCFESLWCLNEAAGADFGKKAP